MTYSELLSGVWDGDMFTDLADVEIDGTAVSQIARLALAGWSFCGASEHWVELERGSETARVVRLHANEKHGVVIESVA